VSGASSTKLIAPAAGSLNRDTHDVMPPFFWYWQSQVADHCLSVPKGFAAITLSNGFGMIAVR
jgi:hypothetical protein